MKYRDSIIQGSPMHILEDGLEYPHNSICALVEFQEEKCELSMPGYLSVY